MVAEERLLRRYFKAMREELRKDAAEKGVYDNNEWSLWYVEHVETRLEGMLWSWRSWKAFNGDLEGTEKWKEVEHSHRRAVAICEEEIILHRQGGDVAMAANHFNKTIASGCWYASMNL